MKAHNSATMSSRAASTAPEWPGAVPSRHTHVRRRAEAYASALYYSECSLRGIAPDDAAAAAENARSRQSRWWLKGNDPEHPSLREEGAQTAAGADWVADDDERSHPSMRANPNPGLVLQSNGDASTDDEGGSDAADAQEDDDDLLADANVPILARDDDLGTSFGTLSSFCDGRRAALFGGVNNGGQAATSHLHSLPSWLSPQTSPAQVSPESCKPAVANCEEVITSYATYPDLTKKTKLEVPSKPLAAAVQVTSESEADDSIYSNSQRCEFRIARRPSNVVGVEGRSRKRVRRGSSTRLDETYLEARVENSKAELLSRLEEGISPAFRAALANLEKYSKLLRLPGSKKRKLSTSCAQPTESVDIDGTWQMISPPEYPSCLGTNAAGERLFTLGRMSFDMYQPSDVVCSIQHQFNTVKSVEAKDLPRYVPKSLRREVDEERDGCSGRLKTYNIIASFTIEDKRKKPLRGILTSYGYSLPDPTHPNRKSIWFSGGTIEPADDDSLDDWMKVFGSSAEVDRATDNAAIDAEKARSLASKIFLGAVPEPVDDGGVVGYHLLRPIGGHGAAYVDLVYMDDELRIMRGHAGSIYVFKRA